MELCLFVHVDALISAPTTAGIGNGRDARRIKGRANI